jgi:xanthine dehydrogenase accessory factor
MNENRSILAAFKKAKQAGVAAALATVVKVTGSAYRRPGAKMLITADGEISGSISGGCLERDLIRRARRAMDRLEPTMVRYDTRGDGDEDENALRIQSGGLGCEGVIEIFINPAPDEHLASLERAHRERQNVEFPVVLPDGEEFRDVLSPPVSLIIFGAGHDAVPMARLAQAIGWQTTIVDCRSSFSMPRRLFGDVGAFISCDPERILERVEIPSESLAFLMTHNYEHDRAILKQIVGHPLKYIGLLGPRARSERLLSEIEKEKIRIPSDRLHFPMGLDIGGETPQAIALSALAEAQAVLSGRKGEFLRERPGPIHG